MDFFLRKKSFLHLNINSLLPKTEKTCFIEDQSNASTIAITESTLDSSILNREVDLKDYNLIRMNHSKRVSEVTCYNRKSSGYSLSQVLSQGWKHFFRYFFCLDQNQFWHESYIDPWIYKVPG